MNLIVTDSEKRIDLVQTGPPLDPKLIKSHLVLSWEYNLKNFSGGISEYKKSKFMFKIGVYEVKRVFRYAGLGEKFWRKGCSVLL